MIKHFKHILFSLIAIVTLSAAADAQPIPRTFGVRRLVLDNNDVVPVNNVYFIDRLGGLGIDNTGAFTGTFPSNCSALLDLSSTSKGLLPPRMTTAQELSICGGTPAEGLVLYNLTTHSFDVFNGTGFAQAWTTKGNYGTNPAIDYLGTFDGADLVFRTNNIEKTRIFVNGNVAIGTAVASANHVQITENGVQTALNVTTSGLGGTGINIESRTALQTNNLLVVNGVADATNLSVAANPVWDSRINGDQLVTGIQKIGGSIWLDGRSATHLIVTDAPVNIGSKNNSTVSLISNNAQRLSIDGSGNTTIAGGNTTVNGGGTLNLNVGNTTINEGGSGKFTINSTSSDYASKINTSSLLGLEVHCTSQGGSGLNSNTHFADFYDGTQANPRGSIQGQNLSEWFADPINIINIATNAANVIVAAAELVAAAASAATVIGVPEGVGFAAQAVGIAVTIASYVATTAIQTTTNLGISYGSSSGDYAEYLKRANTAEKLYPGDIVGVKNGLISKNTDGAQSVFSISLAPIVLGNVPEKDHETEYNKVGFLGQVPVKVTGIVNAGDFIIASGLNDGLGIAVAADKITPEQFTMVIGRAWTASLWTGVKYVKVAVGLNAKAMSEIMSHEQKQIDGQQTEINALKKEVNDLHKSNAEVASMKTKLDRLEKYLAQPEKIMKDVMLRSN